MQEKDVPQFAFNQYLKGPSFYGCFNTGLEATLHKVKSRGKTIWITGPDLAAQTVTRRVKNGLLAFSRTVTLDEFGLRNRTVYMYKTRKAAVIRYVAFCNEIIEQNRKKHARHKELVRRAQQGDLNAALEAGDY